MHAYVTSGHPRTAPADRDILSIAVFVTIALSMAASFLSGCGVTQGVPGARPGLAFSGHVHGGRQPLSNSTIQLYAVSTAVDGGLSTPLLTAGVKTNADGAFSITGAYTCPSASSLVYLTATGGNPGLPAGSNNTAAALMLGLGACGNLSPSTFIEINEVATVASVSALSAYMNSYAAIGASSADAAQLSAAFDLIQELVSVTSGSGNAPGYTGGSAVPVTKIDSWANVLASCVNSSGGAAGDAGACGALFTLATPPGAAAPTETIGAALDMARNPIQNVASLFDLTNARSPFQPSLAAPPADWNIAVAPPVPGGMPQRSSLLGEYLLNEGSGTIANDSSGQGHPALIVGAGWEGIADVNLSAAGQYIQAPAALNQANTWQFALYSPPFGDAALPQPPGYGQPLSFALNPSILCGSDRDHTCFASTSFFRPVSQRFYSLNSSQTEAGQPLSAGWHIVTLVGGQNGALDHYYYDGVEVSGYVHQGSGLFTHPASGNYQIGGSSQFTGTWFLGKIAGVWAWSASLSSSEARAASDTAMTYIKAKGAAPAYAPLVHTRPLIIGSLDSRTAGIGVSRPWIDTLALDDPTYTTLNLGYAGATAFDTLAMYDMLHAPQISGNTAPTIEVFWGGVNDFGANQNMTPQAVADSLKGLVQKAKLLGARVVLATEISFASGTGGDIKKNAVDAIIRAQASGWGADNVADLATVPQLGADGASASLTYFSGAVHPTDAGEVFVTRIMSNAINELNGSSALHPHTSALAAFQEGAADGYLALTGADGQSQTVTLPDCLGYSLSRAIVNNGTVIASVSAISGELLTGDTAISPGAVAVFAPLPGPLSTAGCSWHRAN